MLHHSVLLPRRGPRLAALFALAGLWLAPGARAAVITVGPGESIQEAVDAASPGDTIRVLPGVYTAADPGDEAVVKVTTSGLTLTGSSDAVIDATGVPYGILVGEDVPIDPTGCPAIAVTDFSIHGFTIRDAGDTGLKLVAVDGFTLVGGTYLDNEEYGPFPICSKNGFISRNFASGHEDASIYVGDDENVAIERNVVSGNAIGIEVENSVGILVRSNRASGNTVGILAVVLPGLPFSETRDVEIHHNKVIDNNLPNPVPLDSGHAVGLLPSGSGILNVGGDDVVVSSNLVTGNGTVGLAIVGNPFFLADARIDAFPDGNLVRRNRIRGNGLAEDDSRAFGFVPGADIVFLPDALEPFSGVVLPGGGDPDASDNCFARNQFDTEFPAGVTEAFSCGEREARGVRGLRASRGTRGTRGERAIRPGRISSGRGDRERR